MANCNQTLANLLRTCEDKVNSGGIQTEVLITKRDNIDFENTTVDTDNNTITDLKLKEDAVFYRYQFTKNTASLASTYQFDGTSGEKSFCQNALTLVFRRLDATKRLAITSLMNSETVVLVTDLNGTTYFLGFEEYVSSTSGEFQSGTARTDSNQFTMILSDTTAELPLIVTEDVMTDIKTNHLAE